MRNLFGLFLLFSLLYLTVEGCGNKRELRQTNSKSEFNWKDNLGISDIPDFPVRGYLDGREVRFSYIVFERWRGSNDNVINFSVGKPEHPCGFIESYSGFQFLSKGGAISPGQWVKTNFDSEQGLYNAFYKYASADGNSYRSDASWNCALKIESVLEKSVTGKIALCFDDDKKSWIAGSFEAAVCNN